MAPDHGPPGPPRAEEFPTPREIHRQNAEAAAAFSFRLQTGPQLRFPWAAIDRLVGTPLLPGWLVVIGGRAKAGKSTMMRALFQAWTELRRRVLYVGTEQGAHILSMLWAAARLQIPAAAVIDPRHPDHLRVLGDVARAQAELAEHAIIVAEQDLTLRRFAYWCRFAEREECHGVLLDHFHRMNGHTGDRWVNRSDDIRALKNMAEDKGIVLVAAAQLRHGEGGQLLGEYEVPGPGSWAETAGLRREADVALQLWRPFKPGLTAKQKAEARSNPALLSDIVQQNTMGVRVDAHRYNQAADGVGMARLRVEGGELVPYLSVEQGGLADHG